MNRKIRRSAVFLAAVAGFSGAQALAQAASAQTAGGASSSGLEEVVVTAQKTAENIQKAPASIVAVKAVELERLGITDLQSVEKLLPSATLRQQGGLVQVFIRGIGTRNDLPNFAASSAYLFNGLMVPRYGNGGLFFDLDRVESIAGPQGTLYGGSAAGGAVNAYSALPTMDFSGNADVSVENYEGVGVGLTQNFKVSDTVGLRAAGIYNKRGSWYGRDLDTEDGFSGRFSALIRPNDNFSANLFYSHVREYGEPNNSAVANPFPDPSHPWSTPLTGAGGIAISGAYTRQDMHSDIVGANIDFKLGDNNFTYIPGYIDMTVDIVKFSGITGRQLQIFDHEKQQSHEFRWNRKLGAFDVTGGVYYLHNDTDFNDGQITYANPTTPVRTQANLTDQVNESASVFGQVVFSATDALRFTVGGRYSNDKIDAVGQGSARAPFDFDHSESRADYKVGVAYDLSDMVLVYGNIQSGYIPFGYDPDTGAATPLVSVPTNIVPTSELTAYSGGFKSRFFDSRLEVNAEAYYYQYADFQAIVFNNATARSTVLNAKESSIKGIDIGVRARITSSFRLTGGLVYQNARYDDFKGVASTGAYNYEGNQLINAPDWKVTLGAEQTWSLGNVGDLIGRVDTHNESSHNGNFSSSPLSEQPGFTTTDASLTYSAPGDKWSLQAYVHNIEDEAIFTTLSQGTGSLQAPRTFGLKLAAHW